MYRSFFLIGILKSTFFLFFSVLSPFLELVNLRTSHVNIKIYHFAFTLLFIHSYAIESIIRRMREAKILIHTFCQLNNQSVWVKIINVDCAEWIGYRLGICKISLSSPSRQSTWLLFSHYFSICFLNPNL